MSKGSPEAIRDFLMMSLGKKENQNKVKLKMLGKDWPQIVGKAMADHSRPYKLEGKELWIYADPGGWLQNITLMSGMIVPKINDWWGEENRIQQLKVLGKRADGSELPLENPVNQKLEGIIPNTEDFSLAESQVPMGLDEKLRNQIIKAMAAAKAMERNSLEKGRPKCQKCDIFIENGETFCSPCERTDKEERLQYLRKHLVSFPWLKPKELSEWAHCSLMDARDVRNALLGDLAKRVQPGEEMSNDGLILVMMITGKKPAQLDEETIRTVWNRIQREIRQDILTKIQDRLKELPRTTWEEIAETMPVSIREFEIARRNLLNNWKKEVKLGKEISITGVKAAMLVTGQEIDIWEEERITTIWQQIRKGGAYVFTYRPGKNGISKRSHRDSR